MQHTGVLSNPNPKIKKKYAWKFFSNKILSYKFLLFWNEFWKFLILSQKGTLAHFPDPSPNNLLWKSFYIFPKKNRVFWDECWPSVNFFISPYTSGWMLTKRKVKKILIFLKISSWKKYFLHPRSDAGKR